MKKHADRIIRASAVINTYSIALSSAFFCFNKCYSCNLYIPYNNIINVPKVEQKKITSLTRLKTVIMKRLMDRFYVLAIIFIILGILVLNYSYIEPKPYKAYVVDNVFPVSITNKTNFYSTGFVVGGSFISNISFSDPNGTPFSYRLFYIASYTNSTGWPVTKNQTFLNNSVDQTFYTSPVNAHGISYSLCLIITTNAPHLHVVVTELSWYITRNQSNLFLDEIGVPFLIVGVATMVGRLTYNTSSRTKERNLTKMGIDNRIN